MTSAVPQRAAEVGVLPEGAMTTPLSPLSPEERADLRRWAVGTGSVRVAKVARLLDERDALAARLEQARAVMADVDDCGMAEPDQRVRMCRLHDRLRAALDPKEGP